MELNKNKFESLSKWISILPTISYKHLHQIKDRHIDKKYVGRDKYVLMTNECIVELGILHLTSNIIRNIIVSLLF